MPLDPNRPARLALVYLLARHTPLPVQAVKPAADAMLADIESGFVSGLRAEEGPQSAQPSGDDVPGRSDWKGEGFLMGAEAMDAQPSGSHCPHCGREWIVATSETTGCCDGERAAKGFRKPGGDDAAVLGIQLAIEAVSPCSPWNAARASLAAIRAGKVPGISDDNMYLLATKEVDALRAKLAEAADAAHACGFRDGAADMDKRCAADRDRLAAQVTELTRERGEWKDRHERLTAGYDTVDRERAGLSQRLVDLQGQYESDVGMGAGMRIDKARADLAATTKQLDETLAKAEALHRDLAAANERATEAERIFDLQTKAAERARKKYQEAHPADGGAWPDRADLLVWLMERGDKAEHDCAMGKSLADHQIAEVEKERDAANERAENAEAKAADGCKIADDLRHDRGCAVELKDAARAEAEAAKAELAAMKACKVRLPPRQAPLLDRMAHGYNAALTDCAFAIRAAGVEVES